MSTFVAFILHSGLYGYQARNLDSPFASVTKAVDYFEAHCLSLGNDFVRAVREKALNIIGLEVRKCELPKTQFVA